MDFLITAYTYKYIYFAFIVILLFSRILGTGGHLIEPEALRKSWAKTVAVGLFFVLFFGLRPTVGVSMYDTAGYAYRFGLYQHVDLIEDIDIEKGKEIVWEFIGRGIAALGCTVHVWFLIVALIYISFNIVACRILFPNNIYLAFLAYVIFFLFYQGGINGIRNADAYSIVFCAIALFPTHYRYRYPMMALMFICAYEIHSSVAILIMAFVCACTVVRSTKFAVLIWLGAIFMSLAAGNYLAEYAVGFTDDIRAERYLAAGQDMKMMEKGFSHVGFRWDFLIFSLLPIVIGWYVLVIHKSKDHFYQILLNTYILANAVWVVFIYAAFSNRFAMLSWCIYPYVMIYPFIKMHVWRSQLGNRILIQILCVMIAFTWYMNVLKGL